MNQKIYFDRAFLRSPSINVGMKICFSRHIPEETLRDSLNSLLAKHPTLKSGISIDQSNNAFFVERNISVGDILDFTESDPDDWEEWYRIADEDLCNLVNGPLIKFGVFYQSEDSEMVILILAHHILGDGMAHLNLINDFVAILNGETVEQAYVTPAIGSPEVSLSSRGHGILKSFIIKSLYKKWKKDPRYFSEDEFLKFRQHFRVNNPAGLYLDSIVGESLKKIISFSRNKKFSVNELLFTALGMSVKKRKKDLIHDFDSAMAISVRNDLTVDCANGLGNFVSGMVEKVDYDPDKSFVENATLFKGATGHRIKDPQIRHALFHFFKHLDQDIIDIIPLAIYGDYDNKIVKRIGRLVGEKDSDKNLGVSNLGKYSLPEDIEYKVDNVEFIPPAFPSSFITMGVITYNSKMNLCFRYYKSYISHEEMMAIVQDMKSILEECC